MDSILYWNSAAIEADRVSHTTKEDPGTLGPTLSSRALAIVHLAMYDAYAASRGNAGNLTPWFNNLPAAPANSTQQDADTAAAAAAHAALSALYSHQRLFFDRVHLEHNLPNGGRHESHLFGIEVARRILADRKDDPGVSGDGWASSTAKYGHRVDPDHPDQGYYGPFYGARSRPFAVTCRWDLDKPPQGDAEYDTAVEQVRRLGILPEFAGTLPQGTLTRTPDQTQVGIFWGYDGSREIGTPPRLYNQVVREISKRKTLTTDQNARLFALINVAMADAGILAWEQKYRYDLWRPVIGIREHDPGTFGDPGWRPLGAPSSNERKKNFTPHFPAYPSGHATFGAAAFQVARLFFGKKNFGPDDLLKDIDLLSDEYNGVTTDNTGNVRPRQPRRYPGGLWQAIEENGRSRVYLGVHWLFDAFAEDKTGNMDLNRNVGGVKLGIEIAKDIFETGMKRSSVGPAV